MKVSPHRALTSLDLFSIASNCPEAIPERHPNLSRNLEIAELCGEIGRKAPRPVRGRNGHRLDSTESPVTAAIVGMRSAAQVKGVIGALDYRLSPEEIAEIDRLRTAVYQNA